MARKTGEAIRLIGQWLTEVKERLPHGAWLPWLQTEFGWSDETARKMMRVYECLKSQQSLNLEIDVSALYLIAAPSTPEPVREEVIRRAQSGESMTHAKAVEVVHSHQQRRTMPTFPVDPSIAKSIRKAQRAARKLAAEQLTIRILYEAIELLAETDGKPEEMVVLGRKHDCLSLEVLGCSSR